MGIYLKDHQFLQNFKNCTGNKLQLPNLESPAGVERVDMSVTLEISIKYNRRKNAGISIKIIANLALTFIYWRYISIPVNNGTFFQNS